MKKEIELDEHKSVGPYVEVYGHGPVVGFGKEGEAWDMMICLDCGYFTGDARQLMHEDCDREDNPVNQTMREYLKGNDFPSDS